MNDRPPCLARLASVSASTGWLAALYGALYIHASADFASTGSFWIFGWPFLALLSSATAVNLILAGVGGHHLPSPVGWVNTVNDIMRQDVEPDALPRPQLATALDRLPLFPAANALVAMALALLVTAAMGILEWRVAGTGRNLSPILLGGFIATLLYGATNFTVSDLLISRICQRLRLAGIRLGLDPYGGPTVKTWVRVATLAAPTLLALLVAQRIGASAEGWWVAQGLILVLGSGLCAALAWLEAFVIRTAAADLGQAASRLTSGGPARLVTGSTDTRLVEMARAFNAGADQVDRSLQISAARYSALFEGAGDAIFLVDSASGVILEANRRAEQLACRDQEALKTTRFDALFAADGEEDADDDAPRRHGARHVVRPDGTRCPVDVAVSTVAVGDATLMQVILHDVSERERIEQQLETLVRQLRAQNSELQTAQDRITEADRLKSEFMGMMSHELRTPLNIFVGYTEMLLDAARDHGGGTIRDHRDVLERLLQGAHSLTTLVEDTLSVLRLESAGVRVQRESFTLAELFDELRAPERFLRHPSDVVEHWSVEPDLPALVSDRLKLRQILTNLVGNARKFTTAGSIAVRAARADLTHLAISVEDTGCGIAATDLPYVFDLYRQAATGTAHNGCGIGLYIVRRYCEMLGGSAEVASEVGRGTRMTVTLSCDRADRPCAQLTPPNEREPRSSAQVGHRSP